MTICAMPSEPNNNKSFFAPAIELLAEIAAEIEPRPATVAFTKPAKKTPKRQRRAYMEIVGVYPEPARTIEIGKPGRKATKHVRVANIKLGLR